VSGEHPQKSHAHQPVRLDVKRTPCATSILPGGSGFGQAGPKGGVTLGSQGEHPAEELAANDPRQIRAAAAAARLKQVYLDLTQGEDIQDAGSQLPALHGDEAPA